MKKKKIQKDEGDQNCYVTEETENIGIRSILLILAPGDSTTRRKENENKDVTSA